jgi:hypothetical protein
MKQFNSSVLVTEQTTNVICDVGGTLWRVKKPMDFLGLSRDMNCVQGWD